MIAGTVETLVHVWFPYFFNVDIHEVICPSNSVKPTLREGGGGGEGGRRSAEGSHSCTYTTNTVVSLVF